MNSESAPVSQTPHILVVDDEPSHRDSLRRIFERAGYDVSTADDGAEALDLVRREPVTVVLTDLVMPRMDGQELLRAVKTVRPEVDVVVMTAYGTVENAVQAMREGAYDFVSKPVKRSELLACIDRVLERRALVVENRELKERLLAAASTGDVIGQSPAMRKLRATVEQVAPSAASILLAGESGTGKEVCARAIHNLSRRQDGPFVVVNCAALPSSILETELFGRVDGDELRPGQIQRADQGTLFLDEVGAIPPSAQVRLLRVLQSGQLEPEGGQAPVTVDVRVVAASDADLKEAVASGAFREDLFYKLDVIHIDMPPLRDRAEDVPLLATAFLKTYAGRHDKTVRHIEQKAMEALCAWPWPGNVRELENVLERAVVLCPSDTLGLDDLPEQIADQVGGAPRSHETLQFRVGSTMEQLERAAIDATLRHTRGDKKLTAKLLGISLRTLYRRLGRDDKDPAEDKDAPDD